MKIPLIGDLLPLWAVSTVLFGSLYCDIAAKWLLSGSNLLCTLNVQSWLWSKLDVAIVDPSIPCSIWLVPLSKINGT